MFQNRDVSWLTFNDRVLQEAMRDHPLLERAKFLSIVSSNLKEFTMIRIGSLQSISKAKPEHVDWYSQTPLVDVIEQLNETINDQRARMLSTGKNILDALSSKGIKFVSIDSLDPEEKDRLFHLFKVRHLLMSHTEPINLEDFAASVISNRLYRLVLDERGTLNRLYMMEEPPYAIEIQPYTYIRTEDILETFHDMKGQAYFTAMFIRNGDINYDEVFDQDEEMPKKVLKLLKKRDTLELLRVHLKGPNAYRMLPYFKRHLNLHKSQIHLAEAFESWENLTDFLDKTLPEEDFRFRFQKHEPGFPKYLDPNEPLIPQLFKKNMLFHYPFDSFMAFEKIVYEGAMRPDVKAMAITIYRLAESSQLIEIIKLAIRKGKEVTAVLELRARFEEKKNITYSEELKSAGCKVLYGPKKTKIHTKLFVMSFKDGRVLTQVGSGNYHEMTTRSYTDFAFITSDKAIGKEAWMFFEKLKAKGEPPVFDKLLVAPYNLKPHLLSLIERERKKGSHGYIAFKVNAITDMDIMTALVKASQAGVKIVSIIRSIQCLRPGIKGYTDNLHIESVVGRFLEHSRLYAFGKWNPDVYIGSSDLMTRNLERRHEILVPIEDKRIKKDLLHIFDLYLQDTLQSAFILSDGSYQNKIPSPPFNVQEYFLKSNNA
ncbi:MAG: polyphosphate kinase 1 [Candidatus Izemoplasmataceae bacterium]